jgi:signal transduction histidine kinase
MRLEYSPRSRAERLVATGRLVLVAFSLLAVFLGTAGPTRHAELLHGLLVAYGVYAAVLVLVEWSLPAPLPWLQVVTQGLDLAAFGLFMWLGGGLAGGVVVYFVFSLAAATLRWQWRGTLWTTVAALAVFLGLGVYVGEILHDPELDLGRLLIRGMSLVVVAALLGYMGAHEERARRDMSRLATWPGALPVEVEGLARELLEHAAAVLGGRRVALAWDDPDEPWRHLAWLTGRDLQVRREDVAPGEGPVAAPLAGTSFVCARLRGTAPLVLHTAGDGLRPWRGAPLGRSLQARFQPASVLALRVPGETVTGRLFAFDKLDLTSDDLILGEIVARGTAARLDHFYLAQRLREGAAADERIRLARDLHDGLAQTLAGVALQLDHVAGLVETTPAAARERLRELQRLVTAEQHDLRRFIRHLRPGPLGSGPPATAAARLAELARRIEREWRLLVELAGHEAVDGLPEALAHQAFRIVQEALVNAARHAAARRVRVRLDADAGQLRVTVEDDGRGFGFRGRLDLAALERDGIGPRTLCERVRALGGSLLLDSGEQGTRLDIRLPLGRATA